jgi:hypothetical protein
MKLLSIIAVLLFFVACEHSQQFDNDKIVFLDSGNSSYLKSWFKDVKSTSWIPNKKEQKILESILTKAIKENMDEYWFMLSPENLKYYYRQYFSYINSSNERIIFINAFCRLHNQPIKIGDSVVWKPQNWRENLIVVDGGGDCYWRVTINITTKEYSNFGINGII